MSTSTSTGGFPCSSCPSTCHVHDRTHKHNYPKPVTTKCLITTLPIELLLQISGYLDIPSRCAFTITHKVICNAIGIETWRKMGSGGSQLKKSFLRLLERDLWERHFLCERCEILHWRDRIKDHAGYLDPLRVDDEGQEIELCGGVYKIVPRIVEASVRNWVEGGGVGVCVDMLRCRGEKRFEVILEGEGNGEEEAKEEDVSTSLPELLLGGDTHSMRGGIDYLNTGRKDYTWNECEEKMPEGEGWKGRFWRLCFRLREVRTTVQGQEWFFYFPSTLLFFLPGSKPFRTLEPADEDEAGEDAPPNIPDFLVYRFLSLYWRSKVKKNALDEEVEEEAEGTVPESSTASAIGPNEEDMTGWEDYYRDLERCPTSFRRDKDGTLVPQWSARKIFYYYGRISKGTAWYDTPRVERALQWCTKKMKVRKGKNKYVLSTDEADMNSEWIHPVVEKKSRRLKRRLIEIGRKLTTFKNMPDGKSTIADISSMIEKKKNSVRGKATTQPENVSLSIPPGSEGVYSPIGNDRKHGDTFRQPFGKQTNISVPMATSSTAAASHGGFQSDIITLAASPLNLSQPLDLIYNFQPQITNEGEFILHAKYELISSGHPNLLSLVEHFNFSFCPHISSSVKSQRHGKPPRAMFPHDLQNAKNRSSSTPKKLEQLVYQDHCEFCWTEFEVMVEYLALGVPKATRVELSLWHSLGEGKDVKGDRIWQALRGGELDEHEFEMARFNRRSIRRRWDESLGLRCKI